MKSFLIREASIGSALLILAVFLLPAGLAFGGYNFWLTYQGKLELLEEKEKLTEAIETYKGDLASTTEALLAEQERNRQFEQNLRGQIENISTTIGTLDKLSKTDRELLKKYSKVYFLNENFVPLKLTGIESQYLTNPSRTLQFHTDAYNHLKNMLEAASSSGVSLKIASAYRSFDDQESLKTGYKITYGSGANKFSADQGYSEHQLGTTVDLTTATTGPTLTTKFEKTTAYKWLNDNAHTYGFILSYGKGNDYYQFEPWHWRFVGRALATKLHEENKQFYFYSQREIEKYLVNIFD